MRHKIIAMALSLLVAVPAFADFPAVRNDSAATTIAATNGDPTMLSVDSKGRLFSTLDIGTASATNPIKLEDSVATTGDALMGVAYRVNSGAATLAADGDYTTPAVNALGSTFIDANVLLQGNTALGLLKREDEASTDQAAGVASLIKLQSAISADAAAEDYGLAKGDTGGRLITANAPAGETWSACSASNTGTGNVTIKGLVASNRIYVTSISCGNQSAVSSQVNFKDGTTTIYVGWVAPNTGNAGFDTTLPIPLRLTSGTDFNFSLSTTATSTICCAAGYISTI